MVFGHLLYFANSHHVTDVGHSVWLLTLYNNINAIILFIPMMVVFGELPIIYNYSELFSSTFWIPMSLAGFFGFAIGYVTGLQVKVTQLTLEFLFLLFHLHCKLMR